MSNPILENHPSLSSKEPLPWALIAAHNEEAAIGDIVRRTRPFVGAVWVVVDGCEDETAGKAVDAGARVLILTERQGKAAALRHGWKALAGEPDWSHLILLDGDGQHEPETIPAFLAAGTQFDLVLGRRNLKDAAMPRLRRWTNRTMSFLLSGRIGRRVADSQCGFRLASREFLASREWHSTHFEIESEMILHAAARGWKVAEIPVPVRYGTERSKIDPWRDGLRWFRLLRTDS